MSVPSTKLHQGRWGIAALLGTGVMVNYIDRVNISVAFNALHTEFGISTILFGYLLSAFNWSYAATQLPMGVLLDRWGVKRTSRAATLLWSFASLGAALAPNIVTLFAMRLLLGLGEAPTFPANAKAIANWFPREERSLATSMFDAAAKFGPAVGVSFVGLLLIRYGWRFSFAAAAVLSFVYFVAFYFLYREPDESHGAAVSGASTPKAASPSGATLGYLLKQRKVIGLVIGFFAYNYSFYLMLLWLPSYFGALKVNATNSVLFSSVPWLFATVSDLLIGGFLVDHLIKSGRDETRVRLTVLVSGTLLGVAVAGAMFWITLSLVGLSAAAPVGWSIPALIAPTNSTGKVASILNTGNQLAGVVAPIATAYLVGGSNSFAAAFAVAAALLICGSLSYIFLLGRIEAVPDPVDAPVTRV